MLEIQTKGLRQVPGDAFTMTPSGESATLVCTDGEIYPELASLMPQQTQVTRLVSSGGQCSYHVLTRGGFTIAQFVEIVTMFAAGQFDEAYGRINELKPNEFGYER